MPPGAPHDQRARSPEDEPSRATGHRPTSLLARAYAPDAATTASPGKVSLEGLGLARIFPSCQLRIPT